MSNNIEQTGQLAQHKISKIDYSRVRSQFDGTVLLLLDLMYYGFHHSKISAILSDTELKLELISYIENVLQNIATNISASPSDDMIDAILSIKIPTNVMTIYNRKMKNAIFETIIRQMLATLKSDQSNKVETNEQKRGSRVNITR